MNTCLLLNERPLELHKGKSNRHSVKCSTKKFKEPHKRDNKKQCKEWDSWLTVDVKDNWHVSLERVKLCEDCLLGKKCFEPEDQRMFMQSVWSLCKVTHQL